MIIISGGDDGRMKAIIEEALTQAEEPFILTDDESDIISNEQAMALIVYNANKIRTYLGRLERNTRKQEETMRRQAEHLEDISTFLEPAAVYFESKLDDEVPNQPERRNKDSRLTRVRYMKRTQQGKAGPDHVDAGQKQTTEEESS